MRWELDDRVMRMLFDEEFFVIYILCTYLPTCHLPYVHMRWSCVNKVFVEVLCDTVLFSFFFHQKELPRPHPPFPPSLHASANLSSKRYTQSAEALNVSMLSVKQKLLVSTRRVV